MQTNNVRIPIHAIDIFFFNTLVQQKINTIKFINKNTTKRGMAVVYNKKK
jgi:hypothetical protein